MDIVTYIQGQTKRSLDIINALLEITEQKQRKQDRVASILGNVGKTRNIVFTKRKRHNNK